MKLPALVFAAAAGFCAHAAHAAVAQMRLCDRPAEMTVREQDRLLRFAALVKQDIVMKDQGRYIVNDSLYREWLARRTM